MQLTPQTLSALSIARPLAETLAHTPFAGQVLGRFERACNLVDPAGRVITLAVPEVGNGPFSIVVAGEGGLFGALQVGQPVSVDKGRVVIGNWLLDLAGAALWEPALPRLLEPLRLTPALAAILKPYLAWPAPGEGGSIARRVNALARQAARQLHMAIFFTWGNQTTSEVLKASENSPHPHPSPTGRGESRQRRGEGFSLIGSAPHADVGSLEFEAAVSQLAGLGSGLTPAGDDYLVGVMAALWLLQRPEVPPQIAAIAVPKTTTLSAAFLQAAGQGYFSEAWHGLVHALDSGDRAATGGAVQRIADFGASSGRDALAGFSRIILRG